MSVPKTGILLINLGTPDATDFKSMRRYLKQFLSDKRVIESSGLAWWFILNGIILRKRPKTSGAAYDKIWNYDLDESPLKTATRAQADKLANQYLIQPNIVVDWAMRYGNPSIPDVMAKLHDQGCERLLIVPLYPQYAGATTGSAMDVVYDTLKTMRYQPTIRVVAPYYNHPEYINALAQSIHNHHADLSWKPQVILASLHGLPVDFIEKGDPYQQHCEATVSSLRREMGNQEWQLLLTYQSRTNRKVWLTPDTEETLVQLAKDGIKNVSILAPGFASDCVETLEELGIRAVNTFLDAGGENCTVIPCLNDSTPSLQMLKTLVSTNLQGWPTS